MGDETIIAWTDRTANFWMGCNKVSEGCRFCYAEDLTKNRMGLKVWGPSASTSRKPVKGIFLKVQGWSREAARGEVGVLGSGSPLLVFTGSLMDWAEDHPEAEAIRPRMWDAIRSAPDLHFQLLTKRPERIHQLLPDDWGEGGWPNVWLGTSIEDMRVADRADHLRDIPAVVRFVSYEPALGPLHEMDLAGIDWVIYGGESGPKYRAHDIAWPRAMRDRCAAVDVAYFYKQSSARFTETGIELDGKIVRAFPVPRAVSSTFSLQGVGGREDQESCQKIRAN